MNDVLAELFYYLISIMTKFRMVAERVHQLRAGPQHTVQQQAEREHLPCYDQVYSALLVKPTLLDPTSVSTTTTWCTSTRCSSDINMKQQSHKRELPSVFVGNKEAEQGPTTTFKIWAAEEQIYISLEDCNLATIMEEVKTEKVAINDASYIHHRLHEQGLGQEDAEKLRDDKLQRLLRVYTTRTEPMVRRSADRQQRRAAGLEADPDENKKQQSQNTQKRSTNYSRALQYALTKVTEGDPYRFVAQWNHNDSSGFETWRRLHITYDQGEGTATWHTITYHETDLEQQSNTITKRVHSALPELARRDLQLRYKTTCAVQTEIATSMKMALLMQYTQGDIRSHLL
eukprot:1285001-Amphidinium_carterae.1